MNCGFCGKEITSEGVGIVDGKYYCGGCPIKRKLQLEERIKIISDGVNLKVWIDGVEVKKIRKFKFTQSIDEIAIAEIEHIII